MRSWKGWSLLLYYLIVTISAVTAGNHTKVSTLQRLIEDKREEYNKLVMAESDNSTSTVIHVSFIIRALRYIHEIDQKVSVTGSLGLSWVDTRLSWDPAQYGGIETFMVENSVFWTPAIIQANPFEKIEKIGKDSYWPVRVHSSGRLYFVPAEVFTFTCSLDIALFPMDKQTCPMIFVAYGYLPKEIQFEPEMNQVNTIFYEENGAWVLESSEVKTAYENTAIEFYLTFVRRPSVIIMNIILPIVFLSLLNCVAFLIPIHSGEKISYSMTVLLAITVFLTLVSEHMPRSADTVALLCYYLLAVMMLSILIMIGVIVNINVYHRSEDRKINRFWSSFVSLLLRKPTDVSTTRRDTTQKSTDNPQHPDRMVLKQVHSRVKGFNKTKGFLNGDIALCDIYIADVKAEHNFSERMDKIKINESLDNKESFDNEADAGDRKRTTWKQVSRALDRLFFCLSFTVSIVLVSLYFSYVSFRSS